MFVLFCINSIFSFFLKILSACTDLLDICLLFYSSLQQPNQLDEMLVAKVPLRRIWLVPQWLTISGPINHLGAQQATISLSHPTWVGTMSTCVWAVNMHTA